jgi:hypothetical protein
MNSGESYLKGLDFQNMGIREKKKKNGFPQDKILSTLSLEEEYSDFYPENTDKFEIHEGNWRNSWKEERNQIGKVNSKSFIMKNVLRVKEKRRSFSSSFHFLPLLNTVFILCLLRLPSFSFLYPLLRLLFISLLFFSLSYFSHIFSPLLFPLIHLLCQSILPTSPSFSFLPSLGRRK